MKPALRHFVRARIGGLTPPSRESRARRTPELAGRPRNAGGAPVLLLLAMALAAGGVPSSMAAEGYVRGAASASGTVSEPSPRQGGLSAPRADQPAPALPQFGTLDFGDAKAGGDSEAATVPALAVPAAVPAALPADEPAAVRDPLRAEPAPVHSILGAARTGAVALPASPLPLAKAPTPASLRPPPPPPLSGSPPPSSLSGSPPPAAPLVTSQPSAVRPAATAPATAAAPALAALTPLPVAPPVLARMATPPAEAPGSSETAPPPESMVAPPSPPPSPSPPLPSAAMELRPMAAVPSDGRRLMTRMHAPSLDELPREPLPEVVGADPSATAVPGFVRVAPAPAVASSPSAAASGSILAHSAAQRTAPLANLRATVPPPPLAATSTAMRSGTQAGRGLQVAAPLRVMPPAAGVTSTAAVPAPAANDPVMVPPGATGLPDAAVNTSGMVVAKRVQKQGRVVTLSGGSGPAARGVVLPPRKSTR